MHNLDFMEEKEYIEAQQEEQKRVVYDTSKMTDVEDEEVTESDEADVDVEPYNPEDLSIDTRPFMMDALLRRLQQGSIVLNPNFQRHEVWTTEKKSLLIESLMLNIPLPMFYVASDEDGYLTVVDGLQRISAIRDFVLGKEYLDSKDKNGVRNETLNGKGMRLSHLEFWTDYEGKQFVDLPPKLQNRILETQFQFTIINPGTPEEVKRNIFKRINTGGLPLSSQEIRNAIYAGQATELLDEMSNKKSFKTATGDSIHSMRLEDKELILRFVSFMVRNYSDYNKTVTADKWLGDTMIILNAMPNLDTREYKKLVAKLKEEPWKINVMTKEEIISYFELAMNRCHELFGRHAFRKSYGDQVRRPINRCLFETWAYVIGRYTDEEFDRLIMYKEFFMNDYIEILNDVSFQDTIQRHSMNHAALKTRFNKLIELTDKYAKEIC